MGQWIPEVERFIEMQQHSISSIPERMAIFVVCGDGVDPVKKQLCYDRYIYSVLDRYNFPEIYSAVFPGIIDFRGSTGISWFNSFLLRLYTIFDRVRSINLNNQGLNDFRNWHQITEFVYNFPVPRTVLSKLI